MRPPLERPPQLGCPYRRRRRFDASSHCVPWHAKAPRPQRGRATRRTYCFTSGFEIFGGLAPTAPADESVDDPAFDQELTTARRIADSPAAVLASFRRDQLHVTPRRSHA
jgi:hypothetical protein